MATYGLLDQAEEDALHKSRLISVEEKPFKRITKRLLAPTSIVSAPLYLPPTPPPETSDVDAHAAADDEARQKRLEEHQRFREDVLLDFAAFESSIARIQFLLNSNVKERERYARSKLDIQMQAQRVRSHTSELRTSLAEAQKTLELRKTYDDLAEKITTNKLLRPREDQTANIAKLKAEIAELEKQSKDYAHTWAERRQQFGRIIEEGQQMRRLIRDEKEEVERREGMEEREDADDGDAASQRGRISSAGTPKPDAGGATPHPGSEGDEGSLTVEARPLARSHSPLRASETIAHTPEPAPSTTVPADDVDMIEDGEVSGEVSGEESGADGRPRLMEGQNEEAGHGHEHMDTS